MIGRTVKFLLLFWLIWFRGFSQTIASDSGYLCHKSHPSLFKEKALAGDDIDVVYSRCEWQINPLFRYISGSVTHYFKKKEAHSEVAFSLRQNMQVLSAQYRGTSISFEHNQQLIRFEGQTFELFDSITIQYQGQPMITGLGSFMQDFTVSGPVIWTLSQPYGAADWWPCKLGYADKIDSIDIHIRTPQGYLAASNGVLQSTDTTDGFVWHRWKHRYPIASYLVAFCVSNYTVYQQNVSLSNGVNMPIVNYTYPHLLEYTIQETELTPDMLRFFSDRFINYPFYTEKYGHMLSQIGGGMEHQTISTMGGFNFGLIAHELAHQWFGDYITCRSVKDIWLNEGFASYLAGMCLEQFFSEAVFRQWRRDQINAIVSQAGGAVIVEDTTSIERIFNLRLSYQKAAMILHMIRIRMGDEAFFEAIRQYLMDPELAYGVAETADLLKHFDNQVNFSLSQDFYPWLYGEGHPIVSITWQQDARQTLHYRITQKGSFAQSPFFPMQVPLSISGNGTTISKVVWLNNSSVSGSVELDFDVVSLAADIHFDWVAQWQVNKLSKPEETPPLFVYPNPSRTDNLQVKIPDTWLGGAHISLFTSSGQLVWEEYNASLPENYAIQLPARLAQGVYWLQFRNEFHQSGFRLLKM